MTDRKVEAIQFRPAETKLEINSMTSANLGLVFGAKPPNAAPSPKPSGEK